MNKWDTRHLGTGGQHMQDIICEGGRQSGHLRLLNDNYVVSLPGVLVTHPMSDKKVQVLRVRRVCVRVCH